MSIERWKTLEGLQPKQREVTRAAQSASVQLRLRLLPSCLPLRTLSHATAMSWKPLLQELGSMLAPSKVDVVPEVYLRWAAAVDRLSAQDVFRFDVSAL